MATDFFVAKFFWAVAIAFVVLATVAAISARKSIRSRSANILGSLIRGYFGLMFGIFLFAWIETTIIGFGKVELGHIAASDLVGWISQWSIYMFVLFAPITLVAFSVSGLPFYLVLRKYRLASLTTMLIGVLAASILAGAYSLFRPQNIWCETNQFLCFMRSVWGIAFPGLFAVTFFSFSIPLPLFRQNTNAT